MEIKCAQKYTVGFEVICACQVYVPGTFLDVYFLSLIFALEPHLNDWECAWTVNPVMIHDGDSGKIFVG